MSGAEGRAPPMKSQIWIPMPLRSEFWIKMSKCPIDLSISNPKATDIYQHTQLTSSNCSDAMKGLIYRKRLKAPKTCGVQLRKPKYYVSWEWWWWWLELRGIGHSLQMSEDLKRERNLRIFSREAKGHQHDSRGSNEKENTEVNHQEVLPGQELCFARDSLPKRDMLEARSNEMGTREYSVRIRL